MEEKILEIMLECVVGTKLKRGEFYPKHMIAGKIAAHVMKFISWLSQNTEPRVNDNWAVLNSDYTTYTIMSANEAYQYWLKNINNNHE